MSPERHGRIAVALACLGCSWNPQTPAPLVDPLPTLAVQRGDSYFRVDGPERVVMSRNITGQTTADIEALLDQAKAAGSALIRLHLIHGLGSGVTPSGAVDESWARAWDGVFAHARSIGLYVVPVFGVWADWNDGTPALGFANWSANPWNTANGGPAAGPGELLQAGSAVRAAWLAWVRALVNRWQSRPNVAAWEVFSELDLVTGASEEAGAALAADAAAAVRAGDPAGRPVMTSLSALSDWPKLSSSDAVDIVQVHVYDENLDTALLSAVAAKLAAYGKPVLIGESGLSAAAPTGSTATTAPNASLGIRHAIWAGVVSGALNARALWWEDGYAVYEPPGAAFVDSYATAEAPAARFANTINFGGLKPLAITPSTGLLGGAIGNDLGVVGWLRSAACAPPAWDCDTTVTNGSVSITVPGEMKTWLPVFFDPGTGGAVLVAPATTRSGSQVILPLPDFSDDVAFTLTPSI